ncbi:hypothetical protein [Sphingomonas crusticola]|uniref:hypothetical protein n=1 Tax=Sphingomonas crusticola TaxID=1697973 RepID=UPI0013C2FE9E|nr:hypothetical protein [Sphingomonas crusticola]
MIEAIRRIKWLIILRWIAFTIGAALLTIECYDAFVTPRIDWFWIGLAILQIYVCRPRKRAVTAATEVS